MGFLHNGFKYRKKFTTPVEEMFPQELNKCLQNFYLFARIRKRDSHLLTKIICNLWQHLCAQLSQCFSVLIKQ